MRLRRTGAIGLMGAVMLLPGWAAEPQSVQVARSGSQAAGAGPAEWFTGRVRVEPLFAVTPPARASGARVTFEPGARTAWHSHPLGQRLIVTDGIGWVQQWGGAAQEIRPGDVVWIPPGQKHWHGATANSRMTHIAIQEQLDGKVVDWMEHVSGEQYLRAAASGAQAGHITAFTGTWKLDVAKSSFDPGPAFQSFTITFAPDGTRHLELVSAGGQLIEAALPWSDGKEVAVTVIQGMQPATAISKIQGNVFDDVWRENGKVVETVHGVVSADGRTLAIAVDGTSGQGRAFHNRLTFERQ